MELIIYTAKHKIRIDSEDLDLRRSPVTGNPKRLIVGRHGYIQFCSYYSRFLHAELHRLIAYRIQGRRLTEDEIVDHINGDMLDNRRHNLRVVTKRQNNQNRKKHREGKLVGCTYIKQRQKWRANITINHKTIFLGYYNTELEAHKAYLKVLDENNLTYLGEIK